MPRCLYCDKIFYAEEFHVEIYEGKVHTVCNECFEDEEYE